MLSQNSITTMPFISLGNNELANMLRDQNYDHDPIITTSQNKSQPLFFHELPFYKCSDYSIINECMTTGNKFFHSFENNYFSENNSKKFVGISIDIFSCNYFNEDKFNSMAAKHSSKCSQTFSS